MRPSHVQGKQPHLQKASFLKIWPYAGEKENYPKWTGWMDAWWMSFRFWLSIQNSWFPREYGWIRWLWLSPYNCHWLTPAFVPFLQYWWWMWAGLLHKCPINWQLWRDIELRPRANVCSFSMAKVVNTSASATKAHPNTRSQVSAKLKLSQPSTLWRRHPSSIWSLARLKLWSEWFSHTGHRLTPACVPFRKYLGLMWTGLLHERPINWQGWQNIELAQVITSACFLSAWQKLCNALLILARNRNKQRDSW